MNKWKTIWDKKEIARVIDGEEEFDTFCRLKKIDGFDVAVEDATSYYNNFYNEWLNFFEEVKRLTKGKTVSSVYEVGCGSGVNLFLFLNRGDYKLGGCDYSENMVEGARIITESEDLRCIPADKIDPDNKYDLVMSESVFQYFESLDYAEVVLKKMLEKSNILTYLGEIHDSRFEEELIEHRRKTIEDYEKRYEGLGKLFIDRNWIIDIAKEYGKEVLFTEKDNPDYINGKYEYNCFIY